jgi:hypothetical protein
MDVATGQSHVIDESDRTSAAGFTNVSRSAAQSVCLSLADYAIAAVWIGSPLVAAGAFKLVYDLLIYRVSERPSLQRKSGRTRSA